MFDDSSCMKKSIGGENGVVSMDGVILLRKGREAVLEHNMRTTTTSHELHCQPPASVVQNTITTNLIMKIPNFLK